VDVIKPNVIGDAQLVSSSVPENDYPAWNAATSYAAGARVIRTTTHRVYEAILAGVDAGLPENTPTRWLVAGSTNRWRMLDAEVGSVTSASGSLTVVLAPGYATAIALLEVVASTVSVVLRDAAGVLRGTYTKPGSVDTSVLKSWLDYFTTEPVARTEVVFDGLYIGTQYTAQITLTGASIECGALIVGVATDIGGTQYGASIGIIDYSRKTTDDFGVVTITRRRYAKKLTAQMIFDRDRLNRVYRTLAGLRSTPCVYVGVRDAGFEPLTILGFYKDFRVDISYPEQHYCSLEIEGLI